MCQMGIRTQWSKPWTITTKDSDFSTELQNILDEQFNPDRPNAVWCSDITYIWTNITSNMMEFTLALEFTFSSQLLFYLYPTSSSIEIKSLKFAFST